jgi:hypothetical protein
MAKRIRTRFQLPNRSIANGLGNGGVVIRDLLNVISRNEVSPAVADIRPDYPSICNDGCSEGRPHPLVSRAGLAFLRNAVVDFVDGLSQKRPNCTVALYIAL